MIASAVFYLNNGNENWASVLPHSKVSAVGRSVHATAFGRRVGMPSLPQN